MIGDDLTRNRIETEEEAIKLVENYCSRAIVARNLCDVIVPGDREATVKQQRRAYENWLMHYGAAIGALVALRNVGKISDNAYEKLQQRVFNTLAPRVVGELVSR